jgi:type 2 lantibiotic biosynthesis protein LanM
VPEISSEEKLIRRIAARAAPFWDRHLGRADQPPMPDSTRARDCLDRWRDVLGGTKVLNRRLRNGGVAPRTLNRLLSGAQKEEELPPWASTLAQIVLHPTLSGNMSDRSFNPAKPLPFQEVLVNFVRYARARIRAEAGAGIEILRTSAAVELERQLLAHLTFVASLTLGREFYEFRFEQAPAAAMEFIWSRQAPSTEIYSAYVRHMHDGGLVHLIDRYPVLGRLLSQSVEQWIRASVNFCRRFCDDFADLRKLFNWKADRLTGVITHVRTELSDRHYGGQTVTECVLGTAERVVYKPRTVEPEISFYRLVDWLNTCDLSLDLKVLRALDRTTHGWVEYVPNGACGSPDQVGRFYVRLGMLLCLLHVLAATDIHCENLIASGEHPVIVDLETLLSESVQESKPSRGRRAREDPLVLRTGILPQWQEGPNKRKFDMSALGADQTQDPGIDLPVWRFINTDQMTLAKGTTASTSMVHRVRLGDKWPSVADHFPKLVEGFKEVYFCLLGNRQSLMSKERLLCGFDHLQLRVLIRGSASYARLHLHLLHPEFLRDGIDRSIELEWLARPLGGTITPRAGRIRLYEVERAAMESLDIPHFNTSAWKKMRHATDDLELLLLGAERDSQVIRRRLASFSPTDCSNQLAAIERAVRSRFAFP